MRKRILQVTVVLSGVAAFMLGQDQGKQPSTVVVPKKNTVSPKEAAAIKKIQDAKTPDEIIAAVENLITNFADTIFKAPALYEAAEAADKKGDFGKAVAYGELSIEADPMRFDAMLLVAGELAQHTQKNDLDREEKLTKSEKYVKQALDMIPNAAKPTANVSDADWTGFKKDKLAEGHKDLGLIATARVKWDVAATEYQTAVDTEATPDTVLMARLGNAYNETGKFSDALAILNKVLAEPNLDPRVKVFADSEKSRAERGLKSK
jgi:tetratricopeptide (TPR) repeat protein